ncbi:MAG: ribosome silencing factor [Bacteroidales bacterium]|jgi:ribosome-associated protein|nr:ribosome silencing factor [Bacteroidales bacterium]MBR6092215.1 ribosome silencing factor [Bacteroidales bacterium]
MRIRHENDNTEEVLKTIVETMLEAKAQDVTSLDMRELQSAVTDYFVICNAQSKTQVSSIAEKVIDNVRNKLHVHVYHEEGFENSEWILLDYIDVVVHIFLTEKRDFYKLEDLWADAERKNYED